MQSVQAGNLKGEGIIVLRMASDAVIVAVLIAAAFIDIRTRRIPDRLVLAAATAGLLLMSVDSGKSWIDSLAGGLVSGVVMLIIRMITRNGLGLGDVKLLGCTGIYLGLEGALSSMVVAVVLSGIFSLVLICIKRENRKSEIPFAPFILAGTLAAVFLC